MAYYCFLCNQNHDGSQTEEHFLPRSIDGPEYQWLPVCEASNIRSNSVFDNIARDLLYWVRFQNTGDLKRTGEALLGNGTLRRFKFSYHEELLPTKDTAFRYIFDRDTNRHIPGEDIFAIAFLVGLEQNEQKAFCRGLAKISIGAITYLSKKNKVEDEFIQQLFSQASINVVRYFALDLQWPGKVMAIRYSLGRSDVLEKLHRSCRNQQVRNHVIEIVFRGENSIHIEGMLYSQYGWVLDLTNLIPIENHTLRLENPIEHMNAPENFKDLTLSPDVICIMNPNFIGKKPNIPQHWMSN